MDPLELTLPRFLDLVNHYVVDEHIVSSRTEEHQAEYERINEQYVGNIELYTAHIPKIGVEARMKPPSWWRGGVTVEESEAQRRQLSRGS